jgi:hypothetical protein
MNNAVGDRLYQDRQKVDEPSKVMMIFTRLLKIWLNHLTDCKSQDDDTSPV